MIRVPLGLGFLFMLAASLSSCGSQSPMKPIDPFIDRKLSPEIEADAATLVEANQRFALDLYSHLRAEPGNLFLSPHSISTAFAMANAGAAGTTRDEIVNVFHFPLPQEKLDPTFGALQRSLDRGTQIGGYELRIANRAWGQSDFPFLASYLAVTRDQYGAEMQPANFKSDHEAERRAVNAWVEERTGNRIVDLFPAGSITADTRLVLANAIYFKGLWALPFEKEKTIDAAFQLTPGVRVTVKTMVQDGKFLLYQSNEVQMLDLPYQGRDLSMFVLLPRRVDGLSDLEAGLTVEKLAAWRAGLKEHKVHLAFPRFKFSSKFDLPVVLRAMGMPSAFDASAADFSGIDGRHDLVITGAFHQAFVEVNEEGTEAAAATGISAGITSIPPSFIADHPFLFLIYDHVTGSILFLGRVMDPRG